jgi:hypothetical protein
VKQENVRVLGRTLSVARYASSIHDVLSKVCDGVETQCLQTGEPIRFKMT